MNKIKRKAGQPKKEKPKVKITLRLDQDVLEIIKSQKNQAKYIESLVCKSVI